MNGMLYYVDTIKNEVVEVEDSRDRAMCVSPIFYERKRDALRKLEEHVERKYYESLSRLRTVRKELAAAT